MDPSLSAMVLSAGFGTRLRPLTLELPKALLPVGDRPVLCAIAEELERQGVLRVGVNVHHQSDAFIKQVHAVLPKLNVIHEPKILGTGGGIRNACSVLGEGPLLVWNGDILCAPPLAALADAATDSPAVLYRLREGTQGTLGIGDEGVTRLRGERFGPERAAGDYVGIAVLPPAFVATLPDEGCLVGDGLLPWLRGGGAVRAVPLGGSWLDMGTLESYWRANSAWLSERGLRSFVAEGARVGAGVVLDRTLVGAGANVEGEGPVANSVIWPGARMVAPANGVIATPQRVVSHGG